MYSIGWRCLYAKKGKKGARTQRPRDVMFCRVGVNALSMRCARRRHTLLPINAAPYTYNGTCIQTNVILIPTRVMPCGTVKYTWKFDTVSYTPYDTFIP